MRGRAFRRFAAAGVLTLAVSAIAVSASVANENPHIRIAAPRTSERARTITVSGATTAQFPDLRAYWERVAGGGATCAATFAERPRLVQEWGWNDIVSQDAVGLVSFERKETVAAGDTGELHLLCAYLVNRSGHVGARAQGSYRDPALR
jgi:hypothetical protein